MGVLQKLTERENWVTELLAIPISLVYISLTILILVEASGSTQFLRATEIVVSSSLSLLLVVLYFRQTKILSTQTEIQREQTEILRTSETPEIIMNEFIVLPEVGDRESEKVGAKFSNTGDGLAKNFEITTRLQLPQDTELSGGTVPRGLKREENSDIRGLTGDYIRPGEMGQLLTSDLIIPLNNMSDGDDRWARNLHFEDAIDILTDHNIETVTIVWDINWTDTFGRTEDIHGNEYHDQYFHMNNIEEDMTFVEFMQMEDFVKEQEREDN